MTLYRGDEVKHVLLGVGVVMDSIYIPKTKKTKEHMLLIVKFKSGLKHLDMAMVEKVEKKVGENLQNN